ncbi:hypothetical protein AB0B86_26690 [Micromonospora sp. NPDC049047]|uniref:hypothetical protein n=1 Tax=Micromonospora sp. NPDC049047 TaxID=3155645 RepID=UPI0033E6A419
MRVGVAGTAGPAEQHAEGDQPLLEAVVQVAFDALPFGVDSGDDPGPTGGQFLDPPCQLRPTPQAEQSAGQPHIQRRDTGESLDVQQQQDRPDAELGQRVEEAQLLVHRRAQHDPGEHHTDAEHGVCEHAQCAG